jgi:hypothetical protein
LLPIHWPTWLETKDIAPPPIKNKKGEYDWTDNDLWYEEKLNEVIERFKDHKNSVAALSPSDVEDVDDDDTDDGLPF